MPLLTVKISILVLNLKDGSSIFHDFVDYGAVFVAFLIKETSRLEKFLRSQGVDVTIESLRTEL